MYGDQGLRKEACASRYRFIETDADVEGRFSFSLRPKPSIGAVRLSLRVARFGGLVAPAFDDAVVLALSLSVLVVPFDAEMPMLDGGACACAVCGRCGFEELTWIGTPLGTPPGCGA